MSSAEFTIRFEVKKTEEINKEVLKKVKRLILSSISEKLVLFNDHYIILGFHNNEVICACCISPSSPEMHFSHETNEIFNPYLYNFVCSPKYRKHKISVSLIHYIKDFTGEKIKTDNWSNIITLDVLEGNIKAQKFFERNKFTFIDNYMITSNNSKFTYKMYTCDQNLKNEF